MDGVRDVEAARERPIRSATALLSTNVPSPRPTDSGVHADDLDAPRTRDHRRAGLAADVLGERRNVLVGRMQVAPRLA